MATTEQKPGKLIIGTKKDPVRLTFFNGFKKQKAFEDGGEEKYGTHFLIPKDDEKKIAQIKRAYNEALAIGKADYWNGKIPKKAKFDEVLRDGDEKEWQGYKDHFYINAKSNQKPGIVDKNLEEIIDEDEVYSGAWGVVSCNFFPYEKAGGGIAVGLNNIMKVKDGEKFAGGASAQEDFGDLTADFDEEDLEDKPVKKKKSSLF